MNKSNFRLLLFVYILVATGLLLYSFTQIDLNLTLSRVSLWQIIQKKFMYLGYFKRPLSTLIFSLILSGLFFLYGLTLYKTYQKRLTKKQLWTIILTVAAILFISYPAFSHDIFNYMFDAKTIVKYHKIPWLVKPLDFSQDPWLNFMHWTHRPSIYPPFWIILTLPLYILGFNKFIPIILNFKALMLFSYLGSAYLIGEIMKKTDYRYQNSAIIFFALNPLIIIESLISAHNDILMMFLALLAFYILKKGKRIFGFLTIAFSTGIKWVSFSLLPLVLFGPRRFLALILTITGLITVIYKIEIQPWYFLWVLPFIAINVDRLWLVVPAIGFSLGLILRYTPFLYLGNWDPPVPVIKFWVTFIPSFISIIIVLIYKIFTCLYAKKNIQI